jgi:hypothetical protein
MTGSIWWVLNLDGSSLAETTMELTTVDVRPLLVFIGILGSVAASVLCPSFSWRSGRLPTWATQNDQDG